MSRRSGVDCLRILAMTDSPFVHYRRDGDVGIITLSP